MYKVGGNRNFGYGKNIVFAGKMALYEHFGGGHYGSVFSHLPRWEKFSDWLQIMGIRDSRDIGLATIEEFGRGLEAQIIEEDMKVAYGQNLISTVNVVMCQMRNDKHVWVSPCQAVGPRTHVRQEPPLYVDRREVIELQDALIRNGDVRVAAMVGVARSLSLRFKECCLIDFQVALRNAVSNKPVLIDKGTKGGHPRLIKASELGVEAIAVAAEAQENGCCLIPSEMSYTDWRIKAYNAFYRAGGKAFHDMRAAGGCDLYFEITGCLPPVLLKQGDPIPSRDDDLKARLAISENFGHHRPEIASAYIGPILRMKKR